MMHRRRFLTLCAACAAMPSFAAAPLRWTGFAMGAEVSLELHGPEDKTRPALAAALAQIKRVEHLFSLYDPTSLLSRLNQTGALKKPPPDMLALFAHTQSLHANTQGLFDPTVQALWQAHATDTAVEETRARIGWDRVQFDANRIQLGDGQSLTFNGIAQGYATDLVTQLLSDFGLTDIHVNLGEQAVRGGSRILGVSDPTHGFLGSITLQDGAVATSSALATQIGGSAHIFSPMGSKMMWSTVSVAADTATLADGLSTALCLATPDYAAALRELPGVRRVILVDFIGDLQTL